MTARKETIRRCGARTRSGAPCRTAAVTGKTRCRMHGGAEASGAPRGNRNAVTHGYFTRDAAAARKRFRETVAGMQGELERAD